MCGRYSLYSSADDLAKYFDANLQGSFSKSYNIAPTAIIPVLIDINNERWIVPMRWGFIPAWHKENQKIPLLNNAKIETIDTKPSFRSAFKRHRCLILANGFYEWDATSKPKQPFYFHQQNDEPIALAGIWERWVTEDKSVDSCCIITQEANEMVAKVHERMPGIIPAKHYDEWLDAELSDVNKIKNLAMQSAAYSHMMCYPVTPKMNRVAYNNHHCIEKLT